MKNLWLILLFAAAAAGAGQTKPAVQPAPAPVPAGVFRPWDGTWRGTFVIYDGRGREETRIQVEQKYTSIKDQLQAVVIQDSYPSGWAVTKYGTNAVVNGELRCDVTSPLGAKYESHHKGSYLGPAVIYWYSLDDKGRPREWFYESVVGDEYRIDGAGVYGANRDETKVYVGRYRRVKL